MTWIGPTSVVQVTKGGNAYQSITANTLFQEVSFGFGATQLLIINEADAPCEFSFDGATVHGIVLEKGSDNSTLSGQTSVWIRLTNGTGTVYVRAY